MRVKKALEITDECDLTSTLIWADPETGRLKESDIHFLIDDDQSDLCVVVCNEHCKCGGKCPACLINAEPFPHLLLFFQPDKGWGVVALNDIEAGQLITIYMGHYDTIVEGVENAGHGLFFFELEFGSEWRANIGIDAQNECNIGRFINHSEYTEDPSETFSQPNAMAINMIHQACSNARIGIFARRKIYKGEEITLNYGCNYRMERACACNLCLRNRQNMKAVMDNLRQGSHH